MSEEQKEQFYKVLKKYYEIGTTRKNVCFKDIMQELAGKLTVLLKRNKQYS